MEDVVYNKKRRLWTKSVLPFDQIVFVYLSRSLHDKCQSKISQSRNTSRIEIPLQSVNRSQGIVMNVWICVCSFVFRLTRGSCRIVICCPTSFT